MAARLTRVLVFAKEPVAGRVKTRLIPALGAEGAAALARTMLDHSVAAAVAAGIGPVELVGDPHPAGWATPANGVIWSAQQGHDLGDRMGEAVARALAHGERVLVTGTDCPAFDAAKIAEAAATLDDHDAAVIPALDGGYAAIGLRRFDPSLFEGVRWSGPHTLADTLARLATLGWSVWLGAPLADIDEPADLVHAPAAWLASPPRGR